MLFAKSRAIGQQGKRSIPAHHFDEKNKTGATRIVDAAHFHEIPSGFQGIEHDHGAPKNLKVYNVAEEPSPFSEA
jgi:hypothetical protein